AAQRRPAAQGGLNGQGLRARRAGVQADHRRRASRPHRCERAGARLLRHRGRARAHVFAQGARPQACGLVQLAFRRARRPHRPVRPRYPEDRRAMKPLHAAVVGGGPAGLYFAYLLKKSSPASRVTVVEQNAPDATFGFGVVLADRGLERLEQADAESYRGFIGRMHRNKNQLVYHGDDAIMVDSTGYGGAISRLSLLTMLRGLCDDAGVELHFATRMQRIPDADLVVGADGVNSVVRAAQGSDFGLRAEKLTNWFAWYGTRARFDTPALNFRKHGGGHFVAHYYPYSDAMGTFVAECDAETWNRLGLGAMSDDERQRLM